MMIYSVSYFLHQNAPLQSKNNPHPPLMALGNSFVCPPTYTEHPMKFLAKGPGGGWELRGEEQTSPRAFWDVSPVPQLL